MLSGISFFVLAVTVDITTKGDIFCVRVVMIFVTLKVLYILKS